MRATRAQLHAMASSPAPRSFHAPNRDTLDLDLVRRLNQGDAAAFRAIFDAYATPLVLYGASLLRADRQAAEDIVHDLFTHLWTHRHDIEVQGALRTYLYRATRNRCWSVLRHERVERALQERVDPDAVFAPSTEQPDLKHQDEALGAAIGRALDALPQRQREIWRLNRYEGFSYTEIAALLGLSVKTIETHMARALKELRIQLAAWR
jgi:RNA polymerase sigma-70 factor (ECF subfamily)